MRSGYRPAAAGFRSAYPPVSPGFRRRLLSVLLSPQTISCTPRIARCTTPSGRGATVSTPRKFQRREGTDTGLPRSLPTPALSRVPKFDEALGERDPEFIADFDASGHRARRVIMAGVLVIVLAVLAAAGHVLPMPADSLSVSRWFLAAGLAPLALIALLASTVPRFRHRSGAIQVACVIGIVITQTTLRVLPRPDVDEIITVVNADLGDPESRRRRDPFPVDVAGDGRVVRLRHRGRTRCV